MLGTAWNRVRRAPLRYKVGGGIVLVVLILAILHFTKATPVEITTAPQQSHVHISSVAGLTSQTGPLPVTGKVTSLSEATILAQSSGQIVTLSHALGDRVSAGSVIARFENSSQQASVLQAEGAYEAAQAGLAKASGSTASNTSINASQAAISVQNARASAQTAIQSAIASLDDAVHTKADTLFINPRGVTPTLIPITIPDSQLISTIQNQRPQLETLLRDTQALSGSTDIDATIAQIIGNSQTVIQFLSNISRALNEALPDSQSNAGAIAAYQASITAGRSEVLGSINALTAAKSAYDAAQSGSQTASNVATGGTNSDIALAQAGVKQALGALTSAQANLEKTIVRSPISGTIVSLPVTQGDFVSNFAQVAEVSNPGALQVEAYVTPDDSKTIAVGGEALLNETTKGVIVSIAPAIDPSTGKIQVKIGIPGDQSKLTDNETVSVTLTRTTQKNTTKVNTAQAITIPIIAAKITPQGPVVFTVASSTLTAHPIVLGTILGDQVTVISGLTQEMAIVTDARGLSNNQTVIVDTQ